MAPPLVLWWMVCAPNIDLIEEDIQLYLDKRKPGRSRFTTLAPEADEVKFSRVCLRGQRLGRRSVSLFVTKMRAPGIMKTSRPIPSRPCGLDLFLSNTAIVITEEVAGQVRAKPPAGLARGRHSRKILGPNIEVPGALIQIGPHEINRDNWDWDQVSKKSILVARRRDYCLMGNIYGPTPKRWFLRRC